MTIIAKLNEQVTFNQLAYLFREKADKWLFGDTNSGATFIYENGELKDKTRFQCRSITDRCDSMIIMSVSKRELGQYARSGWALDGLRNTFTSYYLSAYEAPFNVKCQSATNNCRFNQTSNVLTVRENDQVVITCSANFWKSETTYGIPAEIFYRSTSSEECSSNESKLVQNTTEAIGSQRVQSLYLKKDCSRSFTGVETGNSYTCGMRYINTLDTSRNDEIDKLTMKIDVHYGPLSLVQLAVQANEFNKTVKQGMPISIKCPFEGNPITYFWKQSSGPSSSDTTENAGDREFVVPRSLPPGQYQYQCRAYVAGLIEMRTESVTFTVVVQENKATTKKCKFFFIFSTKTLVLSFRLICCFGFCSQINHFFFLLFSLIINFKALISLNTGYIDNDSFASRKF